MTIDPYDLATLFAHRALLDGLDTSAPPELRTLEPVRDARSIALLPGSFNPPTAAHLLLADRARAEGYERILMTLPKRVTGKPSSGLIHEDRLVAVRNTIAEGCVAAVASHGLYAEQAEAARASFPDADLAFLVGSDKVIQIFDDRWYDDRDDALERLFSLARIVCAPRADQSQALRETLGALRNRRWAQHVHVLRLHPAVNDLSSTRVRGLLRAGAEPAGLVPHRVAEMLATVRAYAPPLVAGSEEVDHYAVRSALIDALWGRGVDADAVDLKALLALAVSPSAEGASLRAALRNGRVDDVALDRMIALAPVWDVRETTQNSAFP